jgi:predicted RNA-binding protein
MHVFFVLEKEIDAEIREELIEMLIENGFKISTMDSDIYKNKEATLEFFLYFMDIFELHINEVYINGKKEFF